METAALSLFSLLSLASLSLLSYLVPHAIDEENVADVKRVHAVHERGGLENRSRSVAKNEGRGDQRTRRS